MNDLLLLDVPYDCGRYEARAGAGPSALLRGGLVEALASHGVRVSSQAVRLPEAFHSEWDALVVLQRQVAAAIRAAATSGQRTLVLSGNCAPPVLGAAGGLEARRLGIVWLDAHADLNVPETSPSGFLDGMALAMATGRGWHEAVTRLDLPVPVPDAHLVLVGARDLDAGETRLLAATPAMGRVTVADAWRLPDELARRAATVAECYVHVDMDVLDPEHLRANGFATPGGLTVDTLIDTIASAGRIRPIAAASITSLDPACDARAVAIGTRVALALATA